ncbi:MAG: hypothetical protein WCR56_07645, partial [Bacilli bacterium]
MEEKNMNRGFDQVNADNSDSEEENGVTFGDVMRMILKHWKEMIIFFLAALICGGIYSFGIQKPVWTSTGSVIILADNNTDSTDSGSLDSNNLNLSLNLIPSIVDFMNTGEVLTSTLEEVNESTKNNFTYDEMDKMVTVASRTYTSTQKSLFIDINVSTDNKDLSKTIVNSVINNSIEISNDTSKSYHLAFGKRIVISTTANTPVNTAMSKVKILLIAALIGLVVGVLYGIIF